MRPGHTLPPSLYGPIGEAGTHLFTTHTAVKDDYNNTIWGTYLLPASDPPTAAPPWVVRMDPASHDERRGGRRANRLLEFDVPRPVSARPHPPSVAMPRGVRTKLASDLDSLGLRGCRVHKPDRRVAHRDHEAVVQHDDPKTGTVE